MQLLAAPPERHDQRRLLEHLEVLGHGLSGHVQVLAELPERLPVLRVQPVEQQPAPGSASALNTLSRSASIAPLCNLLVACQGWRRDSRAPFRHAADRLLECAGIPPLDPAIGVCRVGFAHRSETSTGGRCPPDDPRFPAGEGRGEPDRVPEVLVGVAPLGSGGQPRRHRDDDPLPAPGPPRARDPGAEPEEARSRDGVGWAKPTSRGHRRWTWPTRSSPRVDPFRIGSRNPSTGFAGAVGPRDRAAGTPSSFARFLAMRRVTARRRRVRRRTDRRHGARPETITSADKPRRRAGQARAPSLKSSIGALSCVRAHSRPPDRPRRIEWPASRWCDQLRGVVS